MTLSIIEGDCLVELPKLGMRFHAAVTDPPYELAFMGRKWDSTGVAFRPETWRAVYDTLLPGAYLVAFASTRGYHRMVCAIEDAGFIIHPMIAWIFGSGFPKAADASKAIDKHLGKEGARVATGDAVRRIRPGADQNADGSWEKLTGRTYEPHAYQAATPEAAMWEGWKYGLQSLKPAIEPICLAQKPIEGTGAQNLLKHGCGALNIDASRVETDGRPLIVSHKEKSAGILGDGLNGSHAAGTTNAARYPANVIHDGSDEVLEAFAAFGESKSSPHVRHNTGQRNSDFGMADLKTVGVSDSGSPARFFFSPKADAADRADSKHPTVKPVDLIRYLVRLVTPPGGHILDPFAGTGTTAEAAMLLGFDCTMIERDPQHAADIRHRIKRWSGLDAPLFAATS